MKKIAAVMIVAAFVVGACALTGCNAEELKKLGEQAASLTKENADLKDKVAAIDKDKKAIADQLTSLTGQYEQCKKDLDAAKAAPEEKKEEKKPAAPAKKKEEPKKGKKKFKPAT
jgi:predicted  nucleic acid-binding Zn-ribbon protein